MKPVTKALLIGCGSLMFLALVGTVILVVWLFSGPAGGVKLTNDMDQYALEYIAEHEMLRPDESILAYYDATISMDGTEAALLTTERVMYHKNGATTSIPIRDIQDIRHRYESLAGDVIEIQSVSGRVMKIEIAPLNQGETFKSVLLSTWEQSGRDGG